MNKTNKIEYSKGKSTKEDILQHLKRCNYCFVPPLETYVNIEEYVSKLFENATNFEAWDNNKLIGCVNIYLNDKTTKKGFITNVSVEINYQKKGIAQTLIKMAIEESKLLDFKIIELEVEQSNVSALRLYNNFGFIKHSQNGTKLNLIKQI